jgi:AcrR family transcriptional regulator
MKACLSQTKKECILNAATKIFAHFGFKKTSVNEIAESAGVAKGTVYLACESKEDLFYQVLHREAREWATESAKLIDPRTPADQLMLPVLMSELEQFERRPLVRDLMNGKTHAAMPGWEARLDELRLLGRSPILETLRLGVRQKIFRPELDADEVARTIQDLQISAFFFHPAGDARNRIEFGLGLVLGGLRVAATA